MENLAVTGCTDTGASVHPIPVHLTGSDGQWGRGYRICFLINANVNNKMLLYFKQHVSQG